MVRTTNKDQLERKMSAGFLFSNRELVEPISLGFFLSPRGLVPLVYQLNFHFASIPPYLIRYNNDTFKQWFSFPFSDPRRGNRSQTSTTSKLFKADRLQGTGSLRKRAFIYSSQINTMEGRMVKCKIMKVSRAIEM